MFTSVSALVLLPRINVLVSNAHICCGRGLCIGGQEDHCSHSCCRGWQVRRDLSLAVQPLQIQRMWTYNPGYASCCNAAFDMLLVGDRTSQSPFSDRVCTTSSSLSRSSSSPVICNRSPKILQLVHERRNSEPGEHFGCQRATSRSCLLWQACGLGGRSLASHRTRAVRPC